MSRFKTQSPNGGMTAPERGRDSDSPGGQPAPGEAAGDTQGDEASLGLLQDGGSSVIRAVWVQGPLDMPIKRIA
jgi:hypothetical protein